MIVKVLPNVEVYILWSREALQGGGSLVKNSRGFVKW
jgi:hypothetical protein